MFIFTRTNIVNWCYDPRALHCVCFLDLHHNKRYRSYDPVARHTYDTMDVTFFEQEFFFSMANTPYMFFRVRHRLKNFSDVILIMRQWLRTMQWERSINLRPKALSLPKQILVRKCTESVARVNSCIEFVSGRLKTNTLSNSAGVEHSYYLPPRQNRGKPLVRYSPRED